MKGTSIRLSGERIGINRFYTVSSNGSTVKIIRLWCHCAAVDASAMAGMAEKVGSANELLVFDERRQLKQME